MTLLHHPGEAAVDAYAKLQEDVKAHCIKHGIGAYLANAISLHPRLSGSILKERDPLLMIQSFGFWDESLEGLRFWSTLAKIVSQEGREGKQVTILLDEAGVNLAVLNFKG